MILTIELSKDVEAGLLAGAQENGVSPEEYAAKVLREGVQSATRSNLTRSQIAGQRIRELRTGVTLGSVSVRDLIEEGRE